MEEQPPLSRSRSPGSRTATPPIVAAIREGAAEVKIDRGPGYRIYFGWDGRTLVVLLGGGTKRRQQRDLTAALAVWRDYKERKPVGRPGRPWRG